MPPEYLQPQHETSALVNEFNLRYRTLEIRFLIDKERFGNVKQLVLKCSAKIENFPLLTRDRTISLFIGLDDDVANQKLINTWRNSGKQMNNSFFLNSSLRSDFYFLHQNTKTCK